MRAKTVYYTRKNCGVATEKLAFECDKSIVLVLQWQTLSNKIHVRQVQFYWQTFLTVPFTIYSIRNSLLCVSTQ